MCGYLLCVLLIFISFLFISYLDSNCRIIKFVNKVDGKALHGNVITEMTANNIEFCRLQCFLNNDCVSCNFGRSDSAEGNVCQLNNSTDHESLQPIPEYTYVETEVKKYYTVLNLRKPL